MNDEQELIQSVLLDIAVLHVAKEAKFAPLFFIAMKNLQGYRSIFENRKDEDAVAVYRYLSSAIKVSFEE